MRTTLKNEDKLNDVSKDMVTLSRAVMTNSNKVCSFKNIPKCNYTFRYVPRIKSKKKNSKSNFQNYDEFTSLLDGNFVSTNMKLKLKGYKTLRNEHAKDFAFIPGDKSLDLDIMPIKNEEENISYELSKPAVSTDVTKLQTIPLKETKDYGEIESNVFFHSENKISMNDINPDERSITISKEAQESSYNFANVKEKNETRSELEDSILQVNKERKTKSLDQLESQNRIRSNQIESREIQMNESKLEQLQDKKNDKVHLQSNEIVINNLKEESLSKNISKDLSNSIDQTKFSINTLNQRKTQYNFKDSDNVNKIGQSTTSYFRSKRIGINKTSIDYSKSNSNDRNLKDNPTAMSKFRSGTKIPRYSMYESRKEQQLRASSPCGITFIKARENSTKQRWSGLDRAAVTRCYTGGSSGCHSSRSQGSTHPYPPTLQTREVSSKCYTREKDPIVRSNIIGLSSKILRTRNSVTDGFITTININNLKLHSNINSTNKIFSGSKSSTGIPKTSQMFAYGCCKKPKKCCKKKRKETCDEAMIPGKVICTKPKKKDCCPKPKCPKPKKKPDCRELPPLRASCNKAKTKKKKICKRYCCPSLKDSDCFKTRGTCPGKKCNAEREMKDEFNEEMGDTSCLPNKEEMSYQRKNDCDNDNNERDCNSGRNMCNGPKKCIRSFSCAEKEGSCLDTVKNQQELCNPPKKKDCCKRNSRRSKSCGNRRYHSGTKSRKTKSYVTIPMFDVNVVALRPYQNDAVLRFYSSCKNDWKPPTICKKDQNEDSCKCKKPDPPNCLNVKKCENSTPIETTCMTKKDPCDDKPKEDPCAVKKTNDICCKSKTDVSSCKDQKEVHQARWDRELREIQKCKNIGKESCKKKCNNLDNVISSCQKHKCNKFESIDLSNDYDHRSSSFQLSNSLIPFCIGPTDSSLLNFGMKSNNIIPNRSFSITKIMKDIYREELPILIETELPEKEWADEESSSE
ncbi:uncharacterized protein LOC124957060 isoform X2 [Vespa velutina]|nr:uncharacterized protein LOC124957060 isoform X2 [Vespa velutina]